MLHSLLDGSKQFLAVAKEGGRGTSFTSLSGSVAGTIRGLHDGLLKAAQTENVALTLIQVLKVSDSDAGVQDNFFTLTFFLFFLSFLFFIFQCLAVLIENTTYENLNEGYLTNCKQVLRPFMGHKDPSVSVAALSCLAAVFGAPVRSGKPLACALNSGFVTLNCRCCNIESKRLR